MIVVLREFGIWKATKFKCSFIEDFDISFLLAFGGKLQEFEDLNRPLNRAMSFLGTNPAENSTRLVTLMLFMHVLQVSWSFIRTSHHRGPDDSKL